MTVADEILDPTINYCWIDEDGERVSPKHAELGIAISWFQRRPAHKRRIEEEEEKLVRDRERFPQRDTSYSEQKIAEARKKLTLTGKEPADLKRVVTKRVIEEISDAERAIVNQMQGESQ